MSDDITIPTEAFTAAELAYTDALARNEDPLRAACLAMLKAWPGKKHVTEYYLCEGDHFEPAIILPLPQKETSA